MTEAPDQQREAEHKPDSYESLRDEAEGISAPVRTRWQAADRGAANLLELYGSLQADGDLTPDARGRKASEHFGRHAPKIEQSWQQTREELRGAAEALVEMSTPRPKGEKLRATSNEELLTAQNEAARIIRAAERRAAAKGPLRQRPTGVLKEEYQKGMKEAGVAGAARCRGALAASEELGIAPEEWIADLRDDKQRADLDRARRLERASFAVPSRAPRPGAALNSGSRSEAAGIFRPRQVHLKQSSSNLSAGSEHPFQNRTPSRKSWK